jgi:Ca-activated chloride channel family protein
MGEGVLKLMLLKMSLKPHRTCLPAHADDNKLFVALELRVEPGPGESEIRAGAAARGTRSGIGVLFVVDTSGSMTHLRLGDTEADFMKIPPGAPGKTRLQAVIDALRQLVTSERMRPDDRVALVHFDDQARTLIGFTSPSKKEALLQAIDQLTQCSGGTQMGKGMYHAVSLLGTSETASERVVLLTDGNTIDEELVRDVVGKLNAMKVSVICMGLGADWNTELLLEIADRTRGRPLHIVDDAQFLEDSGASEPASRFPELLASEFDRAASEVLTDVQAFVSTVRGVRLVRVTQVEPSVSEVPLDRQGLQLGSVGRESAVFLLEFEVGEKPPSRVRLAQLGLTYQLAGSGARAEIGPRDVSVEFSNDESRIGETDRTVLDYVAARNVAGLLDQAAAVADSDPVKAAAFLRQAEHLTQRINPALTVVVRNAIGQLSSGKTLSLSARKTLAVGARTKTRQSQGVGGLSDADIRRISGV